MTDRQTFAPTALAESSDDMTRVELMWIEKTVQNWVRFGRSVEEKILDRRRRVLSYRTGSVFGFVRWEANDFGTVFSQIDVVLALRSDQTPAPISWVRPGGESLLSIHGWPKVSRVLAIIDAIEALKIGPADVSHHYWRHVHGRLTVGDDPHGYSQAQHKAWLTGRAGA